MTGRHEHHHANHDHHHADHDHQHGHDRDHDHGHTRHGGVVGAIRHLVAPHSHHLVTTRPTTANQEEPS